MKKQSLLRKIAMYHPEMERFLNNPQARSLLEEEIDQAYDKYKNVTKFANLIDNVDKYTGTFKAFLDVFGIPGKVLGTILDLPELMVKGAYGMYYTFKTGDYGAAPGWAIYEGASSLLPFGQILDTEGIYTKRIEKTLEKMIVKNIVSGFLRKFDDLPMPEYNVKESKEKKKK